MTSSLAGYNTLHTNMPTQQLMRNTVQCHTMQELATYAMRQHCCADRSMKHACLLPRWIRICT